jgi:hypothetical protein
MVVLSLFGCSGGVTTEIPEKQKDSEPVLSAPEIEVAALELDFGSVEFGQLIPGSLDVTNIGGSQLTISSITADIPFYVSPSYMTLDAGATGRLTINTQLLSYGDFTGSLTLVSDDAGDEVDETNLVISLHAATINDEDGDGHDRLEAGGDDCDDSDPLVYTGAEEVWYDGIDEDCSGGNDYDQDGDGYESDAFNADPALGGGDCQDVNPDYHPGAPDQPYDNRDTDCRGDDDWDYDQDGYQTAEYGVGSDCDDYDPLVNRDGTESFNAKDDDCDDEIDEGADPSVSEYIYTSDRTADRTGQSTALGDLDNDGDPEVIIGSSTAEVNKGTVAIFDGRSLSATGTAINQADWYIPGSTAGDQFGSFVTVIGDYDMDGTNDLAIGAPGYSASTGIVYLINGDEVVRNATIADAMVTITGNASSQLGRGLVTNLDLDGDGMADLVMLGSNGGNAAALLYGSGIPQGNITLSSVDAFMTTSGNEAAFYRNAPVGADMDGDGYEDLVLSDGNASENGYSSNGAAWILWGQTSRYGISMGSQQFGISAYATTVLAGTTNSEHSAWATQPGGDWDNDGDSELWSYTQGVGLFVVEGRPRGEWSGMTTASASVFYDWSSGSADAESIRQIGDWTGDGLIDMLVYLEDTSSTTGVNELFSAEHQSGSYSEEEDVVGGLYGSTTYGSGTLGYGISPLYGDIDQDGDHDIVIGDPGFDGGAGEAYVLINRLIE